MAAAVLAAALTTFAPIAPAFAGSPDARSDARSTDLASVQLAGQVVHVEDGEPTTRNPSQLDGDQTLLRLPGGELAPVDGLDDVPTGSTVQLTADLPQPLESDVGQLVGATALDQARDATAAADSPVAAASALAASANAVPLQTTSVDRTAAADAAASPAAQTVTFAVVGVNGSASSAFPDATISSLISSVSSYWSGQSAGAITFAQAGTATRYTSSIDCSNSSALWNEAATNTGFHAGSNRHLVLLLPLAAYTAGHCSYGLGTVGSSVSTGGEAYVSDDSWPALAHELGHNMSLLHANELTCGTSRYDSAFDADDEPTSSSCSVTEYGDGMDVMSTSAPDSTGNLNTIGLARLGVLPAAQVRSVTVTGLTTLTLADLSSGPGASGIRSVQVTDPRNNDVYLLENRQYDGRDQYGWQGLGDQQYQGTTTGYGLRVLRHGLDGATVLIDPTPTAQGTFDPDAVVAPGTTFTSASGGVQISAVQNNDLTVTARIDLAAAGQSHSLQLSTTDPAVTSTAIRVKARMLAGQRYPVSGTVSAGSTPPGTVSLRIGNTVQTLPLDSAGSFGTTFTPEMSGDLVITASYAGDSTFDPSSSSATVTVLGHQDDPVITVTTPAISATAGSARVTVLVTGGGAAATGDVSVLDGSGRLGSATLDSGRATMSLASPGPGKHALRVVFTGDDTVAGGAARTALVVGKYSAKLKATLARTTISRSRSTSVTVVVSSAGGVPSGTVRLSTQRDGVVASARVRSGTAKLIVPTGMTAGRHAMRVIYGGSATVAGTTSAPLSLRVTS